MGKRRQFGLVLGPLLMILLFLLPQPESMSPQARAVAAITLLMAVWWISEAIPMAATALLPIVLFPLLGVMSTAATTASYANHLIYLFLGGFLIAMAMQKWNLHRRIALHTIRLVGVSPSRTVLGFMIATAFLSMWISNTATAMMMLPIGLAVIGSHTDEEGRVDHAFAASLMLGIAYAASIGGVATLIGTPPNAILAGVLEKLSGISIGFADWLLFAFPLSLLMLLLAWLYLTRVAYRDTRGSSGQTRSLLQQQLHELGPLSREEGAVMAIFTLVAAGWILRGLMDISWLKGVSDASIAMAGAVMLFVVPSNWREGQFLLDWQSAVKLPWEIIILFGGGFTLASGFADSGLTVWVVHQLDALHGVPVWLLVAGMAAGGRGNAAGDISYRGHLQYRYSHHRPSGHGGAGRCHGGFTHDADDSCRDRGFLCLYAAGGHAAQCDCFQRRLPDGATNGTCGPVDELAGNGDDCTLYALLFAAIIFSETGAKIAGYPNSILSFWL